MKLSEKKLTAVEDTVRNEHGHVVAECSSEERARQFAALPDAARALLKLIHAIENDGDVLGAIEAGEDALRAMGELP